MIYLPRDASRSNPAEKINGVELNQFFWWTAGRKFIAGTVHSDESFSAFNSNSKEGDLISGVVDSSTGLITTTGTNLSIQRVDTVPLSNIIYPPLPPLPGSVQPAIASGQTPPSSTQQQSSSTQLPHNILPRAIQQPPNQLSQAQPQQSQPLRGQRDPESMSLLSILSNAGNSAEPVLPGGSGQPAQVSNKVKEDKETNAGIMLLDSLLSSTVSRPQPNPAISQAPPPPPILPQPVVSESQQQSRQQAPRKGPFDFISSKDAFAPPSTPPHPTNQPSTSRHSQSQASEGKASPTTFDKGIPPPASPPESVNIHGDSIASGSQQGDHEDLSRRKSIELLERLTRAAPSRGPINSNDDLPSFGSQSHQTPSLPSQQVLSHQRHPSYSQTQGQSYSQPQGFQSQQPVLPPQLAAFRNALKQAHSPLRQEQTQAFRSERDQSPALPGQTLPSINPAAGQADNPGYDSNKRRNQVSKDGKPMTDFKADFGKGNEFGTRSPAGQATKAEQNFTFDLSLPLAAISASNESSRIGRIASFKSECSYIPGCAIGVGHWIAYAKTKGRVRLISLTNRVNILLNLPPAFSPNSSIIDLVASESRLASVTSDGGFVAWEVSPAVKDEVPPIIVSVPPNPQYAYKSIKWHPNDPDMLALSTATEIHLINISRLYRIHAGESIGQNTLVQSAEIFPAVATQQSTANPLAALSQSSGSILPEQQIAAFSFDPSRNALATISQEGQLNLWATGSQQSPSYQAKQQHQLLWSGHVAGEGTPSSLFFMNQTEGVIIGRKRNTIIQLVSPRSTNVQASVKYTYGNGILNEAATSKMVNSEDFLVHLAYDPKTQCLWAASSHRSSIMALKITAQKVEKEKKMLGFEQILDFPILHPTVSLGILIGNEGLERGSSNMALVAYSLHVGGVDQVLIEKEGFEAACQVALGELPLLPPQEEQKLSAHTEEPTSDIKDSSVELNDPASTAHPEASLAPSVPLSQGQNAPNVTVGVRRKVSGAQDAARSDENEVHQGKAPEVATSVHRRSVCLNSNSFGLDPVIDTLVQNVNTGVRRDVQKLEGALVTKISDLIHRLANEKGEQQENDRIDVGGFGSEIVRELVDTVVDSIEVILHASLSIEMKRLILPLTGVGTKADDENGLNTGGIETPGIVADEGLAQEQDQEAVLESKSFPVQIADISRDILHVKQATEQRNTSIYPNTATEIYDRLRQELLEENERFKREIVSRLSGTLKQQGISLNETDTLSQISAKSPIADVNLIDLDVVSAYSMDSQPTTLPPSQSNPQQSVSVSLGQQPQERKPRGWENLFRDVLLEPENRPFLDVLAICRCDQLMPLGGQPLVGQSIVLRTIYRIAGSLAEVESSEELISLLQWLSCASQALDIDDALIQDDLNVMLSSVQENLFRAIPRMVTMAPSYSRQMIDVVQTLAVKSAEAQKARLSSRQTGTDLTANSNFLSGR